LVSKFKGSVHGAGKALLSVIKQTTAKIIWKSNLIYLSKYVVHMAIIFIQLYVWAKRANIWSYWEHFDNDYKGIVDL
jgi:hypothetical protein